MAGVERDGGLPSADAASHSLLDFRQHQQLGPKTTTLSTIVVNSGSTRVVIALVQTKDWLELKVLELTPALTLLGIDLEEAVQLQQAHNEVLIRIQSKQSPVEDLLRQADRLIINEKGRAEVYAAMADSLALAWRDVNTQLQRRKTILDLNVNYHRNATLCLERTKALEMSVSAGASLPVEVPAIEELLERLHQARRAMLESLMLALQDGRCLLDELQSIAAEGTLDSRPDHIRTAANCAVSQVEHWLENLHDRRRLLEVSYGERKTQLEQCLTLALLTIDLRQLENLLEKRQESLERSRDELGDSEASSQLLLHEHRKLLPEAKEIQEQGLKILKASEELAESGHFAGEEAVAQAYALLNNATEYFEQTENRDGLLMQANSFFRSAQTAITKLDQLEVQLNTADFTATPAQLAALHGNIARSIENATESALQEGYSLLESAPGSESVKRKVEEIETRKIQLNVMCVESSERSIKSSKVLNNFLEKQNQLYSWLVSTVQSFIQGHQDMGGVLAMAKDFLQQHTKMLNELQVKSTEINALLSTLPSTLDSLENVESKQDCKEKAEELARQRDLLRDSLERRTQLARAYVKVHSLAVELASDMDALQDTLQSGDFNTSSALVDCKQRWASVQQLFLQFVNSATNFTEDSYKVGNDAYLDVAHARVCVATLSEHFSQRKAALSARFAQCEQTVFQRQQAASNWQQIMADAKQTVDWVSKLDAQLYPIMNEEITSSLQMSKDIEFKMKTVLPEVKKALNEVQSRIRTANDLIGTGEVPNRDDSVLIKLKELEDKLHNMISDYQVLLELLISFFKNLSELENKCLNQVEPINLGDTNSMDSVEFLIKEHDANRQAFSELFRFTHSDSLQIIDKIKAQEPEPAREKDVSTLRRMVEEKRSLWERSWTERRLELEQRQQLCQFDVDLEHIYNNIEQLEQQLLAVRGQYGESLATAKATSLTFLYFEKTIQLLQQRIETFVSAAEVMTKADGNSSKHIQVEVSRLRKRWEEFEKQVSESRRLIDLSIQFFTLVEEAEDWFREGGQLLVTIARRSSISKTPEDATEMLNELEIFFKPGESIQDDRINKIADLAEQLFVGEARPPAQVSQVREESREMKNSFQQVSRELKSILDSYKQQPEKMDVSNETPQLIKQEQNTTTVVSSTEKTMIEVIENGVTTARKQKSPSPPPKKAKYQEIEAIATPPTFIEPLADAVINEGSRFTFHCRVSGAPLPSVQWLKDGISIDNNPDYVTKCSDDGSCSLTIEETFTEDSALFTCRAANSAGSIDSSAKLTVKECAPEVEMTGPIFLQPLLSVTGVEGGGCTMTCQVAGNPLPTVQWSKGDVCIDHSPDYCITYNNGLALMRIEELSPSDQAQYTCKASNQVASDSSTAWLFVKPKESQEVPKFITPLSTNLMARAGQKIRLECQVSGKPTPNITWSFNGKPIKESKDVQIILENGNASLVISEAYPKDAGVYAVCAVNAAGEASESCQVTVKGILPTETSDSELASDVEPIKPSIQLQLKDCAVFEGMKVRLDCIIVGQPEPEVIWYHEERPVKESEDFQLLFHGDRCSLIIQEAYVEDGGEYKVVAINSAGEASSKCRLTVQSVGGGSEVKEATRQQAMETTSTTTSITSTREKRGMEKSVSVMPRFTQLLTDVLVPVGESVTLECTVDGQPMPLVNWLHNSRPIVPSERIKWSQTEDGHCTLHLENVTAEDKGNYTALVQSGLGEAKCFAHLIVKGSTSEQEADAKVKHDDRPVLPSFTELFADRCVCLGEPTKFECIVSGKPTPKVRWLFNDKPVAGKDMLISTSGPRQVLSVPSATTETAGQITCIAENEAGKAACTAKLQISDAPIDILLPTLENIKLSETQGGVEMRRHVVSEASSSRVYSTISSESVGVGQQPHVQMQSVSTRSEVASQKIGDQPVVQVERHETKEYQQKDGLVSEQKTELKSKSIGGVSSTDKMSSSLVQPVKRKLIPPKFSTLVMGKIVDQGVDIALEGIVDGFPQPDIKWLKNGEELFPGSHINMSQDLNRIKLIISNVSASDAGKYTCTASNPAGTASCTADLVVKKTVFPPVMGRRLQASARTVGERIVMEIEVTGTPDPEVKWYKDGQQIPASSSMYELRHYGNSHSLVIERATQSHSGKYTVCAVNSAGEAKSTADLLVQQPQLPMDIIEQTTTNITSSHEVIHHPQPMKSIENLSSFESLQKDSHRDLREKSVISSDGSAKQMLLGDTVSVVETIKTDKQVSLKLSHSSGASSWSDEKLDFQSYGKKTPIPIIESPLPFHPPAPYLKEEITTITPEMQNVGSYEKESVNEEMSAIEESHIAKKDALNFFKNIITENKLEEEKLQQHMTKSTVNTESRPSFKESSLFSQEYSTSQVLKSNESQFNEPDSVLFGLEPGPPPEMGFIPNTPTNVLKKEDVFERVRKLEESQRILSEEEIPTGAVKIFPSTGKSEPSVSAISSSIPVTVQAAAAVTPALFMSEACNRQSFKDEVHEEIIIPQKVEAAGSDEKTYVKKNHFLENSSNFESSLSPVFRPQADINVRPQSPRPSAEAVSMEKLWTSRQKETVEFSQSSQWKSPAPETNQQPEWKSPAPETNQQPEWESPVPETIQQPEWKSPAPETNQQPEWKSPAPVEIEQPLFEPPPSEPPRKPLWKHVQPPEPVKKPIPIPQPVVEHVEMPVYKQPVQPDLPPWHSVPPEPSLRPTSPLPSAEAVAMEKLWSHKHSESSLKTVWPPPLPSDLNQQAPWVETVKTDSTPGIQSVQVAKDQSSFIQKSFTEKVSKETKSFSSQFSKTDEKFTNSFSQAPSFAPQNTIPPPPNIDSPKIIYVAETHASHSMNLPSHQTSSVSEISTSSISKSEFNQTIENVSNVVEERTLKPSEAKALWDSNAKTQDSYVPPPKKVQPKKTPPSRPYSVHELNFEDLHLEPGPPPEIGFAQPPKLDRRLSQVEMIEQDLEKDLEKEPSRQLVGAVRIIPPPKKEVISKQQRNVNTSCFQQTSSKQSKSVEFKRSSSLDKDNKFLELEPFPFKPEPERPRTKVFGKVPKPSKFVKKSFVESDYESEVEKARIPPLWTPYESDSEGPTYRKVRPNFAKSQPKRPHSVASVGDAPSPSQFEKPQPLKGPCAPTLPTTLQRQQSSESKLLDRSVDFQSKNTIVRQFQSSSVEKSSRKTTPPVVVAPPPPPSRSPPSSEVDKPKQESPKSKQKVFKVAAPDSGYMADTDEPRLTASQLSSSFSSQSQVMSSSASSYSQETVSKSSSTQKQSLWKPSVPSSTSSMSAAFNKESASSQIMEQTKLSAASQSQQQQQQRPAKRSVGPPPPSPSKFVKGEFRESDYESDYEGRIPVKWRPSQTTSLDVESREFKPVHPVLEVSKRLGRNREGRSPTPPSAFDVPPQIGSFSRNTDIFENSQLVKPKALSAVSGQGFQSKPGASPRMDFAAPAPPCYKIPTGSVGLETSNSMSFAEATESSKRVVSMQQTTRVIKFDDTGKKSKRGPVIRPVTSDVESDYESGKTTKLTSWPPENPLQFEAEQKRLQRVEEMRRRFSDKTSTPPILTPGETPQYGFVEPIRTAGQSTVDASSVANKHMNEMSHSFKSKAQKFASDVMTDVQVTKQSKKESSLQNGKTETTDDSQAYREESRLSEYGKKQIDPDTGLIYFKYDFGYEFGVVMPGEGKPGKATGATAQIKAESTEGSVPVPVIHETTGTRRALTSSSDQHAATSKRLSAKSVKWEQTSESELSDAGHVDVARRKKQPNQPYPYPHSSAPSLLEPHIFIPQTPTPQSLSPSCHSLSPYFPHGHESNVSPGSSLASGMSPGGIVSGASSVVNPSIVPENARKPPLFITPLRNIAVLTGNAARFECIVQAEPAPNILWAHDGRILQPSDFYNIQYRNGVCRLTLPKAQLSDDGTYTCTATNLLGTAGTTASLQVSGERRSLV